eukprot:CCRYP_006224-RB/>CCRYP_006224-RB protein AED:0.01 eAED:0.01 QI:279/1/1/1/0/0/2/1602/651
MNETSMSMDDDDAVVDASTTSQPAESLTPTNPNGASTAEESLLQSHIVPPSHILPDGRFVRLPPPTEAECASFFERAAASHRLISSDEVARRASQSETKKKKKKTGDAKPYVHPLAVASARLRGKGVDELSKAINLGTLVAGGEYFGLTNVVNRPSKKADGGKADSAGENAAGGTDAEEATLLDRRLRSSYALRSYRSQYEDASSVLAKRSKRLLSSLSARRVLDARLRALRRRWRLAAPERRPGGMVRARDVVAVDVEVYDCNRKGGEGDAGEGYSVGRIARRVPRFATMELDEDYDVSTDVTMLREYVRGVWDWLMTGEEKEDNHVNGKGSKEAVTSSDMDVDGNILKEKCKTKAEPFATADPTLGQIDPDFDPDKVPLLTLLFEIEKPSTGFVQRATLSSSFSSDQNKHITPPDEKVIEALQHSLFCASLFESMRAEIIPPPTQSATHTQQRNESVAWLSSEMEDSFLPPPSFMAGQDARYQTGGARLLCVVHCHEGEVKVQLDDEYCLTAKLIEAGTAAAAAAANANDDFSTGLSSQNSDGAISGSQSPAWLQSLCKALLLHSQSLYHDHCMKTRMDNPEKNDKAASGMQAVGLARTKKETKSSSPRILQSCVGLGCKFIFEKKVRMVLKVSFDMYRNLILHFCTRS